MLAYFKKGIENTLDYHDKKDFLTLTCKNKNRDIALMKILNPYSILANCNNLRSISLYEWKVDMDLIEDSYKIEKLLFFDTETSHLNGFISSIAFVLTDLNGNIIEKKYIELNPGVKQSPEAVKVHGLTDEYLKNKKKFYQVVKEISDIFSKADSIVAQNAIYDIGVIVREYERMNLKFPDVLSHYIDTMTTIANQLTFSGKKKNPSLKEIATAFNINLSSIQLHNSLDDTMLMREVFLLAMNEPNKKEVQNG